MWERMFSVAGVLVWAAVAVIVWGRVLERW